MKRLGQLALLAAVALAVVACAKPPDAQVQQARAALQAAQAAGAATYAPEAWSQAQAAMDRLNQELSAQSRKLGFLRNYGRAVTLASQAAAAADKATTDAGARKAQLQSETTKTIADLRGSLKSARDQLAAASRTKGLDVAGLRSELDAAQRQLDQAQTQLGAGQLDSAMASSSQARDGITEVLRTIERATGRAPSKKR